MRRIVQLSDLHFGRHDPAVVEATIAAVVDETPDLVVVSGDFTQRARRAEFRAAAAFLARFAEAGVKTLSVPGNHDVPLWNVFRRFLDPVGRYRKYIDDDLCPFAGDAEMAVLGINTARSLTIKDGRVNEEQMARMQQAFADAEPGATKVLVTHHPLVDLPWGTGGEVLEAAGRSSATLDTAMRSGVQLLLAGHHHRPFSGAAAGFRAADDRLLVIQAGTATSTRTREHANSFNRIDIDGDVLTIAVREWDGQHFTCDEGERFRRVDGRWDREERTILP